MGIKIYTPGHGMITDSLIMYGIVGSLSKRFPEDVGVVSISFTGHEYVIDLGDFTLDDVADAIAYVFDEYGHNVARRLLDEGKVIQLQSRGKLEGIISRLSNTDELRSRLNDLTSKGHILRLREGRSLKSKVKDMDTIWLALMPSAGKYRLKDFSAVATPYLACILCRGLASLGLYFTGLMSARGGDSLEIVPVFNGEITGDVIMKYINVLGNNYTNVANKIMRVLDILPTDILSKLTLVELSVLGGGQDLIEELYKSNASWHLISVRFTRGASQLRGYDVICVDPLIKGLYLVMKNDVIKDIYLIVDTAIRRLIDKRKARTSMKGQINVDVDAIDYMIKFLEYRNVELLYRAVRTAYKDDVVKVKLSYSVVKELAKILGA